MKIIKYLKLFTLPSVLIAILITGFSVKNNRNSNQDILTVTVIEDLGIMSSFYYKPAGDSRLCHITNKYGTDTNGRFEINNSAYTFTADSVTVINEIASMPELEPKIPGLIFKNY